MGRLQRARGTGATTGGSNSQLVEHQEDRLPLYVFERDIQGIGGAIIGFGGVKQYSAGTNGIFGWLQVINPQTGFDSTVVAAIIACIASFVSAVVLMKIFDKKLGIDHI